MLGKPPAFRPVDHLLDTDEYGPAQLLQCQLDNFDRPNHAGTESSRLKQ